MHSCQNVLFNSCLSTILFIKVIETAGLAIHEQAVRFTTKLLFQVYLWGLFLFEVMSSSYDMSCDRERREVSAFLK
jgi:hypothetical protein